MKVIAWLTGIAVASASSFGVGLSWSPSLEGRTAELERRLELLEVQQDPAEIPAEITARSFSVVNDRGEKVGGISAQSSGGFLYLSGEIPMLQVEGEVASVTVLDQDGNRAELRPLGLNLKAKEGDTASYGAGVAMLSSISDGSPLTLLTAGTVVLDHGASHLGIHSGIEGSAIEVMTGEAGIRMQTVVKAEAGNGPSVHPWMQMFDSSGVETVTLGQILDSVHGFIAVHGSSGKPEQTMAAKD